jgi:hypothetical protein
MMNAKTKGQISEARALYEFQKRYVPVAIPWGDNERYDMIAEFNGKLNKIQIKTCTVEVNGGIVCYCRSSTNHTTNKKLNTYQNDIDYFLFVNPTNDSLALVPIEVIGNHLQICLRIRPTKNNQKKNTHYFDDYLMDKIIQN